MIIAALFVLIVAVGVALVLALQIMNESGEERCKLLILYLFWAIGGMSFTGSFLIMYHWTQLPPYPLTASLWEFAAFVVVVLTVLATLGTALFFADTLGRQLDPWRRKVMVRGSITVFLINGAVILSIYVDVVPPALAIYLTMLFPFFIWSLAVLEDVPSYKTA